MRHTSQNQHSVPDAAIATEQDILSCFRLLLGRGIHPEERSGHLSRVGAPLRDVVSSFLSSAEFDRQALVSVSGDERPEFGEFNGVRVAAHRNDPLIGRAVLAGAYEPEVQAIVHAHLRPGMTFLDVGANIGAFALTAAKVVGPTGLVVAIEPNVKNVRLLEMSRQLNGFDNVEIHAVAADQKAHLLAYNNSYSNGTTTEPASNIEVLMRSTMVQALPIDTIMAGRHVDFIKIDVEGFEFNALRGASVALQRRPWIVSEFAPPALNGGAVEYLNYLFGLGYKISVIGTDGTLSVPESSPDAIMAAFTERNGHHIDIFAQPA